MTRKRKCTEEEDGAEIVYSRNGEDALQTAISRSGIPSLPALEENGENFDNPATIGSGTSSSFGGTAAEANETQTQGKKKPPMKHEDCMKRIELECEWNMCTDKFKKMERLCSHIAEHLGADCKTATEEGHLCIWRECGYLCASLEELHRHVYFHGFHTKLKAIGTVLMNHYERQCILDSSGRNMIPEIPEAFQCIWQDCDDQFASAQAFYWHVQSHVLGVDPNDKKQFVCSWDGCTSSFKVLTRLKDHTRSHTQEKLVGCPICGGIYSCNTKFFDHCVRQIPINLQQFQCSHCSTKFANERLLRDHVRRHINHFKCSECEMTCATKSTLLAHVRYRHSTEKPHKCPQCDKCFKSLMDVGRHLTVHSEEPAFPCPFADCEYACRSQTTLNRHIRQRHSGMRKNIYACHICDAKFSLGIFVTRHLIKVHSFHWPAGHSRFRYKQDEDGIFRLQTIRYESIELTQEGDENLQEEEGKDEMIDSPETVSAPPTPGSHASSASVIPSAKPLSQIDSNNQEGKTNADKTDNRLEKIFQLKPPSSPKLSEYSQLLLPSEFEENELMPCKY